jgi:hypothetical protein
VKNIWEKHVHSRDPIGVINIKLKRLKKHCKGCGANLFGNNMKRKLELKK